MVGVDACLALDETHHITHKLLDCDAPQRTSQGFWTNIKDAVYEKRDADGFRCEILCSECDGCVFVAWPCTP